MQQVNLEKPLGTNCEYIKISYIHKYSCSINKKEHKFISSEPELNQWPMDYNHHHLQSTALPTELPEVPDVI